MSLLSKAIGVEFRKRFHDDFILIHSPGRVNLIGEHTDYNEGFVLPAAIDKAILLALSANSSKNVRLHSVDMDEYCEVRLEDDFDKSEYHWANYILGVLEQLQKNGYSIKGFDCAFGGDIPIGAGLSSSAALEGGIVYGLSKLFNLPISKTEMAKIGQRAENHFVGVQCGIMDQFANIHGKKDYALKLDCRSLEFELIPFQQSDIKIVMCDTRVHRELSSSEYNIRRKQCEQGVQILKTDYPDIHSLRDVGLETLNKHKAEFPAVVYQRCRYVLEENERVLTACDALASHNIQRFGELMFQSHVGLRDLYEVSCRELDHLVEIAEESEGVYGSRMMGGGFGGCTINLVENNQIEEFVKRVRRSYRNEFGSDCEIYTATIHDGTKQISANTVQ